MELDGEFSIEDVESIIKGSLQTALADAIYDDDKADVYTNDVIEAILAKLQGLQRPFKYAVTCVLSQKNGAAMHTSASTYWDVKRDGMCEVPWENGTLHVVVTVFGLAINPSDQQAL